MTLIHAAGLVAMVWIYFEAMYMVRHLPTQALMTMAVIGVLFASLPN